MNELPDFHAISRMMEKPSAEMVELHGENKTVIARGRLFLESGAFSQSGIIYFEEPVSESILGRVEYLLGEYTEFDVSFKGMDSPSSAIFLIKGSQDLGESEA